MADLVRAADLKKKFSKGDTTNWSNRKFEITERIFDIIPSYLVRVAEKANRSQTEQLQES